MTYKIYGLKENPRFRVSLVAALYEGVDLEIRETRPNSGDTEYLALFPLARGKTPAFEGPGISISESVAISHYICSISNKTKLLGSSKEAAAEVLQWSLVINSDFVSSLFEQILFLPPFNLPYNKSSVSMAEKKFAELALIIEKHLQTRTFLVGERITLADIYLASYLVKGFEIVLDASWRACHPNLVRHALTMSHQPHFFSVLGKEPVLIEQKLVYVPPKKEKAPSKPAAKADKKEAANDEEEPALAQEEPKAKHPCEALGPAKCFPFDEWKRKYSNSEFPEAMEWLEKNIDLSEYSFWRVTYKYNDELTQIFMSSNLIGGFHNRLEASRKYLFGSAGVYGKANASKIQGAYMIRGADHKPVFEVAPDWESYEFAPLDFKKDIDFIKGCWNWDNTFDGLEYSDGKVFK
ncbi:elongation factor 1-gamma 1 [Phakopsora pachyrhizi]|uniref:Elongation factor 1-gamma 1 n=1 Tax=Phakopsora pachyrhizi TaxID=170000 RepID=A0AAV0B5K0_PHAPC|nr:elongation factor 1-gamma 1 [Phakopsora pachyrhizi]